MIGVPGVPEGPFIAGRLRRPDDPLEAPRPHDTDQGEEWSRDRGLNSEPSTWEADALPVALPRLGRSVRPWRVTATPTRGRRRSPVLAVGGLPV